MIKRLHTLRVSFGFGRSLKASRLSIDNDIVSRFAPESVQNEEIRDSGRRGCAFATGIRRLRRIERFNSLVIRSMSMRHNEQFVVMGYGNNEKTCSDSTRVRSPSLPISVVAESPGMAKTRLHDAGAHAES